MKKPVVLVIADGLGVAPNSDGNAVSLASTPFLDKLWSEYPTIEIQPASQAVGLPEGQMGNSEVGHLTIGAGRVIDQPLVRITKSISTGEVLELPTMKELINHVDQNNSKVHIIGLISDGGVHSHIDHIIGLNKQLKAQGKEVIVHTIMDGRDTEPSLALKFAKILRAEGAKMGSISGRYFAMDRDSNFDRTEKAFDVIVNRKGNEYSCVLDYIEEQFENGKTDEFIEPAFNNNYDASVNEGDAIIFANFRPDRARQLSHLFVGSEVYDAESHIIPNTYFASMMEYASIPTHIIFEPEVHNKLLGEVLADNNIKQLRAAETEKFAHVTFFMDGGKEVDFEGEEKVLIPSPKVATYDLQPEMSAIELTDTVLPKLEEFDVVIMNYANPDMVGHTGNIQATVTAVETVSQQANRIYDKVMELGGVFMLTADHGNAEMMLDKNGNSWPAHTTNPVNFSITDGQFKEEFKSGKGTLANIAPTIIKLVGIEQPTEMTSESLIE